VINPGLATWESQNITEVTSLSVQVLQNVEASRAIKVWRNGGALRPLCSDIKRAVSSYSYIRLSTPGDYGQSFMVGNTRLARHGTLEITRIVYLYFLLS